MTWTVCSTMTAPFQAYDIHDSSNASRPRTLPAAEEASSPFYVYRPAPLIIPTQPSIPAYGDSSYETVPPSSQFAFEPPPAMPARVRAYSVPSPQIGQGTTSSAGPYRYDSSQPQYQPFTYSVPGAADSSHSLAYSTSPPFSSIPSSGSSMDRASVASRGSLGPAFESPLARLPEEIAAPLPSGLVGTQSRPSSSASNTPLTLPQLLSPYTPGPSPKGSTKKMRSYEEESYIKEVKRIRNKESSQRFRDRAKDKQKDKDQRVMWLEKRVNELEAEAARSVPSSATSLAFSETSTVIPHSSSGDIAILRKENEQLRQRIKELEFENSLMHVETSSDLIQAGPVK